MYLKKYQIKQIKRYSANKILFNGLNSKKIWLILSTQNVNTLKKQLAKIKTVINYKYLLNSQLNDFLRLKKKENYLKTVTIQIDSFYNFENVLGLLKKTASVPKFFFYNNIIYDYTLFYKYKQTNSLKKLILPLKIKKLNKQILLKLIQIINYTKC